MLHAVTDKTDGFTGFVRVRIPGASGLGKRGAEVSGEGGEAELYLAQLYRTKNLSK